MLPPLPPQPTTTAWTARGLAARPRGADGFTTVLDDHRCNAGGLNPTTAPRLYRRLADKEGGRMQIRTHEPCAYPRAAHPAELAHAQHIDRGNAAGRAA
jgi:hypothetical protein